MDGRKEGNHIYKGATNIEGNHFVCPGTQVSDGNSNRLNSTSHTSCSFFLASPGRKSACIWLGQLLNQPLCFPSKTTHQGQTVLTRPGGHTADHAAMKRRPASRGRCWRWSCSVLWPLILPSVQGPSPIFGFLLEPLDGSRALRRQIKRASCLPRSGCPSQIWLQHKVSLLLAQVDYMVV